MVLHLWAQGLGEGDEHPYALLWSMVDFTCSEDHTPEKHMYERVY